MASLWDRNIQDDFADDCLKLMDDWGRLIPATRQSAFQKAVNEVARAIQMPEFTFYFSDLGAAEHGNFGFQTWRMNMNSAFTKPSSPAPKEFFGFCGTLYHEAHHAEQWFRCVQGVAKGVFPLPLWGRASKTVKANVAGHTAKDIAEYMWVPESVANRAQATRMHFPAQQQPAIQRWYDSIYGIASQYRGRVLGTASHGIDGYRKYLQLPEEVDAWNLTREFRGRLKAKALVAGEEEAITGLPRLFD